MTEYVLACRFVTCHLHLSPNPIALVFPSFGFSLVSRQLPLQTSLPCTLTVVRSLRGLWVLGLADHHSIPPTATPILTMCGPTVPTVLPTVLACTVEVLDSRGEHGPPRPSQ